jgi:hypothetical protein
MIEQMTSEECRRVGVIDSHTGGEPTRLLVSGGPELGPGSHADKWNPDSVRPPVFPARVETLAALSGQLEPQHSEATGGH